MIGYELRCREHMLEFLLEFLLDFDGWRHWYEGGCVREIRDSSRKGDQRQAERTEIFIHTALSRWPEDCGTRTSGQTLAFAVEKKARSCRSLAPYAGRSWPAYPFTNAEKLIDDFFNEVERVLTECGVPLDVVADDDEE